MDFSAPEAMGLFELVVRIFQPSVYDVAQLGNGEVKQEPNHTYHFRAFLEPRSLEEVHQEMAGKGVHEARTMSDAHIVVRGSGRTLADLCVFPPAAQKREKKEGTTCGGSEFFGCGHLDSLPRPEVETLVQSDSVAWSCHTAMRGGEDRDRGAARADKLPMDSGFAAQVAKTLAQSDGVCSPCYTAVRGGQDRYLGAACADHLPTELGFAASSCRGSDLAESGRALLGA